MSEKGKRQSKTTEKVSPKEIADRIKKTAESLVTQIGKQQDPEFTTMQRGKSNVVWDENKGYLELGEKEVTRTFLNVAHARKFMQTTMIMNKPENLDKGNQAKNQPEHLHEASPSSLRLGLIVCHLPVHQAALVLMIICSMAKPYSFPHP